MKKNLKARVISFFMSFAMLFQILPITVFAAMNPPTIVSVGGINVDQETNMGGAPTVIKGQAYSAQVVATGAELTYTAGVGSYMTLPAGLTINSETGLISGNCTAENGRYDVYIEVSNATGKAHAIVGFTVGDSSLAPVITTEAGSLGTTYKDAYNYFMVSIDNENGVASDIYGFNWSLVSGSLPDGMSLLYTNKPTVHISGTPTETDTFTFELKAENDFGSVSREFSISVVEGEVKPNIIKPNAYGELEVGVIDQAYEYQLQATGTNTQENPILWSIDDDDFTQESGDLGKGLFISKTGLITGTPKAAGTIGFNVYAKNSEGIDSEYLYFNIYDNGEATSISVTPEVVVIERGSSKEFNVSLEGYGDVEQEAYWGFYMWDDDLGSAFPMPTNSELNVDGNTPSGNVTLTVGENEETQQFRVVAYSKSGNNGVRAYATVMVDADYKFITQPQTKKLAVGEPFYPAWELNFVPDEVIIEYDNEGVWSIWNTANATGGTILAQDNPLTLRVKASKNDLSIYSEEFQASWEDNYEFSVTPNTIEWGNVDWTGSYSEKTATIENIGTKTFYVECSTNDEFNISIDNVNNALMPGGQTILHITPKQDITAGNHNFNLTLKSTDGDEKWSMNLPVSINVVAPTFTTAPQGGTVTVDSTHTVNFAFDKEPDSLALQWYNDYSDAWAHVATLENDATSATVPAEDSAQTKQYRILATYGLNTISSEFEVTWEEPAPTTYTLHCFAYNITDNGDAGKVSLETDLESAEGALAEADATENTSVTINAVANPGYEFVEWRKADMNNPNARCSTTPEYSFDATENVWYYAIFQKESVQPTTYAVTVTKGTASPTSAAEGATVEITADTPDQGKEFDKWIVNAGGVTLASETSATTTFTMGAANVEVEATYKDIAPIGNIDIPEFAKQEEGYSDLEYKGVSVTITNNARIDPAKTSVVLSGRPDDFEYILNQNQGFMSGPGTWNTLLKIRPKTGLGAGLSIATITLKYDCDGDGEYETIIGSGEVSFGVSAKRYTVTVTKGTANVEKAKEGAEVTITANNPEEGKGFDKWIVNAGGVTLTSETSATTTFTMGTANVEVEATYKEAQPQLQPITAIDVTCPGYIIGGNIANAVPTTATQGVTITYYEWQENDNGSKLESGTFAADTQYRLAVYLNVNDGYTAENLEKANVKIDGKETSHFTNPCLGNDAQIGDMKIYHYPDMLEAAQPETYTVTVSASPVDGGTVTGGNTYNENAQVTVVATPNNGYNFVNWTENGNEVSTEATYTFGAIADRTLIAVFEEIPVQPTTYTIAVSASPQEGGTVTGGNTYNENAQVTVTATPNNGYNFVNWTENGNEVSAEATYTFTATANRTLVAVFEEIPAQPTTYTIAVSASPQEGGTVTGGNTYEENAQVTVVATPNNGYNFVNWTENGDEVSTEATYTFGATANRTLVAVFEEIPVQPTTYTVTFENNGGTAVTAIENVTSGSTIEKPTDPTKSGYTFAGWYKDAELTKEFNFATDTITENTTLYAKWNKKQTTGGGGGGSATTKYTITVKQNDNGKISPETTKVEKGDNQKFEIKADKGYEVEKVLVDGKSVGAVTEYTFEKVKEKHTIEATFKKVEEVTEETWKNPFTDVTEDDWFYEAVKYANENKLFNGVSSTEFGPNVSMTRAMLVTVLYRLEGEPATNRSIPFADVDMSMYYANAVIWAKQNNIVNGVDETTFAPNLEVTREQLVTILYRYAQYKGKDVSVGENTNILSYDDFSELSEYAIPAMQWACGSGIITGRTTSTIAPKGTATRAEVATMLMRFTK